MHAYLLIGSGEEEINNEAQKLASNLKATLLPFPLEKIKDVRELSHFAKLLLNSPQAIYIKGIERATQEAQNAFLKILEEPQKNLIYILTSRSLSKVLPTITSRCQIIKVTDKGPIPESEDLDIFYKMDQGDRLSFVDKFKKRGEASDFIENFIKKEHSKLTQGHANYLNVSDNLKVATKTYSALSRNGNVLLQLTDFVLNIK